MLILLKCKIVALGIIYIAVSLNSKFYFTILTPIYEYRLQSFKLYKKVYGIWIVPGYVWHCSSGFRYDYRSCRSRSYIFIIICKDWDSQLTYCIYRSWFCTIMPAPGSRYNWLSENKCFSFYKNFTILTIWFGFWINEFNQ